MKKVEDKGVKDPLYNIQSDGESNSSNLLHLIFYLNLDLSTFS